MKPFASTEKKAAYNMGIGGNTGGRKYFQHFFSIVLQFPVDRFAIKIKFQL